MSKVKSSYIEIATYRDGSIQRNVEFLVDTMSITKSADNFFDELRLTCFAGIDDTVPEYEYPIEVGQMIVVNDIEEDLETGVRTPRKLFIGRISDTNYSVGSSFSITAYEPIKSLADFYMYKHYDENNKKDNNQIIDEILNYVFVTKHPTLYKPIFDKSYRLKQTFENKTPLDIVKGIFSAYYGGDDMFPYTIEFTSEYNNGFFTHYYFKEVDRFKETIPVKEYKLEDLNLLETTFDDANLSINVNNLTNHYSIVWRENKTEQKNKPLSRSVFDDLKPDNGIVAIDRFSNKVSERLYGLSNRFIEVTAETQWQVDASRIYNFRKFVQDCYPIKELKIKTLNYLDADINDVLKINFGIIRANDLYEVTSITHDMSGGQYVSTFTLRSLNMEEADVHKELAKKIL